MLEGVSELKYSTVFGSCVMKVHNARTKHGKRVVEKMPNFIKDKYEVDMHFP